jgi:predicted transposase YbfD/YdcC
MNDELSLAQSVVFLEHFQNLPDHRQRGKVRYPLDEILLLCLLAVLAGAETIIDITRFGDNKLDLLRRFRPFEHGVPAHDHLGDILAALDPEAFRGCFIAWVSDQIGVPPSAIAIDGKAVRRSYQKSGGEEPIHIVSAFATAQRLVLGQVKVDAKSNEITAIPKLLDLLDIKGSVISIDAMGCQRAIAQKIKDKGADYLLALKGNQTTLCADVELFIAEQRAKNFVDAKISRHEDEFDKNHGRIERRTCTVIHEVDWLQAIHAWPGLKSLVIVESYRESAGKIQTETRLYICSLDWAAAKIASFVRAHWEVEAMHWIMDMVLRDDEARVRKDNAPENFTIIKHMATNLLRRAKSKDSLRLRRKVAAWDDRFLISLIQP